MAQDVAHYVAAVFGKIGDRAAVQGKTADMGGEIPNGDRRDQRGIKVNIVGERAVKVDSQQAQRRGDGDYFGDAGHVENGVVAHRNAAAFVGKAEMLNLFDAVAVTGTDHRAVDHAVRDFRGYFVGVKRHNCKILIRL